jgi:hypothetical protein
MDLSYLPRGPHPFHNSRYSQSRHSSTFSTQSIARIARPAPTAAMGKDVAAAARLSDVEAEAAASEDDDCACVDDRAVKELDAEVLSACEVTELDEDEELAASSDVEVAAEVAAEMTTRPEVSPELVPVVDVAAEMITRLEVSSGSTSVVETSPALPVSSGPSTAAVSWPISLSKSKSKPTAEACASMLLSSDGSAVAVNWSMV